MARGNGVADRPMTAVPDVHEALHTWDSTSTQIADRSTAMARELLTAGLHWMAQGAAGTGEWVEAFGAGAQRWSEMVRMAEHKARQVDDLAGLWNVEMVLLGETTQSSAELGQQAWVAQVNALMTLSQDATARTGELMQRWFDPGRQFFSAPGAAPQASESVAPPMPAQLPQAVQTMAETAQAFWTAMAAQTAAAMQAPQDGPDADKAPSKPAGKRTNSRTNEQRRPGRRSH